MRGTARLGQAWTGNAWHGFPCRHTGGHFLQIIYFCSGVEMRSEEMKSIAWIGKDWTGWERHGMARQRTVLGDVWRITFNLVARQRKAKIGIVRTGWEWKGGEQNGNARF